MACLEYSLSPLHPNNCSSNSLDMCLGLCLDMRFDMCLGMCLRSVDGMVYSKTAASSMPELAREWGSELRQSVQVSVSQLVEVVSEYN